MDATGECDMASALSKLGSRVGWEKGVRHQKCEAPVGPFRLLVPDPFFSTRV